MAIKTTSKEMKIDELIPHKQNPRAHPENQIKALKESIIQYGQFRQIVVDEKNVVLAGHGILQAMKEMELKTVRVFQMTGLKPKEKKKLLLIDNRTQSMGYDDYDMIETLVKEINSLSIPGFHEDVLQAIIESSQEKVDSIIENEENRIYGESVKNTSDEDFFAQGSKKEVITAKVENRYKDQNPTKAVICPKCETEIWLE